MCEPSVDLATLIGVADKGCLLTVAPSRQAEIGSMWRGYSGGHSCVHVSLSLGYRDNGTRRRHVAAASDLCRSRSTDSRT